MKNILITGGAGFLGSHLTEKLLQEKDTNVISVDNFITSDFYTIEEFVRIPNFEFLKHDLTEPLDLESFTELASFKLKIYGIEEIYHLACPTSPKDYDKIPLETCLANSHATKNALDIARTFKSHFLFVSSSAVYGKVQKEDQPVKEDHVATLDTLGPRSCYNDGKRFAEILTKHYGEKYNFPTKIVREFTTYGPKMRLDDGRMIPDMVSAALKSKDLIIHGDKEKVTSFCYVSDMIDGLITCMRGDELQPMNMGGEHFYKVSDVATAIITLTGSGSKVVYKDPIPFRDPEPLPDITRAKEKLGWLPITPLEEGLAKTVKAMQASKIMKFEEPR